MIQEKGGLLITNVWTGKKYLYPVIYDTQEQAKEQQTKIPQATKNNSIEVVKIKTV